MKYAWILILLVVGCYNLEAQKSASFKQTIRGIVVDEDSKSPIIGANIIIIGSDPILGTTSDIDGRFKIENIPVGRHSISISYLGYENETLSNLLVGSGKELVLEINLVESIVQLNEVTVTAGADNKAEALNEMAMVSARSFSVEETKRFAAGAGDPARMITAYAGVAGNGGDDQNAIIIRGNSPRGLLWRLEGVEIPNPNHFASEGASSGGISILSSNTLTRSDFYTGAFPAEFGNALSGAFDIKLRKGNNEKREYAFQASVLGLEAAVEGPFKKGKRASYLLNYRYSTLALFNKMGIHIVDEDEETEYQDAAIKLNFPTQKAGEFSLFGIGGLSTDKYKPTGSKYVQTTNTDMGVLGISHLIRLSPKSYLRSFAALSGTRINATELEDNSDYNYEYLEKKTKTYGRIGTKLRTKINARHILETGLIYSNIAYNFNEKELISFPSAPTQENESLNEKGNSNSLQAYTSWKYRISEKLSFVGGMHFLFFGLNKNWTIEPRSALKWTLSPGQSISMGFGIHSRIESLEYYLAKVYSSEGQVSQTNKNLDFTKARHYVLGYDKVLGKNWYFKIETYLQELYNVPVHHDPNNIFSTLLLEDGYIQDSLVNKGTGTNYGLELTIQRFFNKDFYLLFSASIYDATYKAADGKKRNTPFNSNFGFNLLAGKEFVMGKNNQNLLGFNLRTTFGGNRRYIPTNLEASRSSGFQVYDLERAYESRLPNYWKVDFQISYRINKPQLTHEFRIDLLNIGNRRNIATSYYNDAIQGIEYDTQTGFIPAFGYRVEF